jgi:hypothetical protein
LRKCEPVGFRLNKLFFRIRIDDLVSLVNAFENKSGAPAVNPPADADLAHLLKGINKIGQAVVDLSKEEHI